MLKSIAKVRVKAGKGRFVIVASRYNSRYVDAMLREAKSELAQAGAAGIEVIRVPGAYEIPVVAMRMARTQQRDLSAIICLGVILRGQTTHAEHIGSAVSQALTEIQLAHEVPVIHEVLLLENEDQARVRCLPGQFNRGKEAAQTALAMALVMEKLKNG